MQISELTLRLILLILPGAIATILVEALTVHKKWEAFRFILYSAMLGFLAYGTTQMMYTVYSLLPVSTGHKSLTFWQAIVDNKTPISFPEILTTCITAIPLGFIISFLIQYKALNRLANRIKVTNKFGEDNLFSHFLNLKEVEWIWVRDNKQGVTYSGHVDYFSETDEMKEIVLSEVSVYRSEDSEFIREAPYIYLSFAPNDFIIELPLYDSKEELKNEETAP